MYTLAEIEDTSVSESLAIDYMTCTEYLKQECKTSIIALQAYWNHQDVLISRSVYMIKHFSSERHGTFNKA